MLKAHVEELLLILLQNENSGLKDRLPPINDEVVPDAKQFPHVLTRGLVLHCLGEQRDEVAGAEVAAVDALLFQMNMQVGQEDRDETVQTIEVEFQHR